LQIKALFSLILRFLMPDLYEHFDESRSELTVFETSQQSILLTVCSDKKALNSYVARDKITCFMKNVGNPDFSG